MHCFPSGGHSLTPGHGAISFLGRSHSPPSGAGSRRSPFSPRPVKDLKIFTICPPCARLRGIYVVEGSTNSDCRDKERFQASSRPGRKLRRSSPPKLSSVSTALTHRIRFCTQTDLRRAWHSWLGSSCVSLRGLPTPCGAQSSTIHRTLCGLTPTDSHRQNQRILSLTWFIDSFVPSAPGRQKINIITESEFCVRLFADNSIKPRRNRKNIQRVRGALLRAKKHHDVSISCTKAHTGVATPWLSNASADELAAGCSTETTSLTSPPLLQRPRYLLLGRPRGLTVLVLVDCPGTVVHVTRPLLFSFLVVSAPCPEKRASRFAGRPRV